MTLIHHVFFWLKNPTQQADKTALMEGLQTLTQTEGLQSFHIGSPAPTDRSVIDNSYSVSWLCIFESSEAQERYQSDPVHLKFVENCSHLWEKVLVYDSI